jgi:hypothetical protein
MFYSLSLLLNSNKENNPICSALLFFSRNVKVFPCKRRGGKRERDKTIRRGFPNITISSFFKLPGFAYSVV